MRYLVMAALAATALSSPAAAQQGFYAGIEAGLQFPQNHDIKTSFFYQGQQEASDNVVHIDYDNPGFDGDIIAGYDFGQFRVEGEIGLKRSSHERYDITMGICTVVDCSSPAGPAAVSSAAVSPAAVEFGFPVNADGSTRSTSFMINGLIDFDISNAFRAYMGPGVGYHNTRVRVELDDPEFLTGASGTLKDHGLALQAIAGVAYRLTDQLDLGLKYRFFRTSKLEDEGYNYGDDPDYRNDLATRVKSHSLLASLIYNFAAPMAPPVAPAPAPMPEPAPAPATQTCSDGSVILATDSCPVPPPPPAPAPERG